MKIEEYYDGIDGDDDDFGRVFICSLMVVGNEFRRVCE
jgi:hypothetical protein